MKSAEVCWHRVRAAAAGACCSSPPRSAPWACSACCPAPGPTHRATRWHGCWGRRTTARWRRGRLLPWQRARGSATPHRCVPARLTNSPLSPPPLLPPPQRLRPSPEPASPAAGAAAGACRLPDFPAHTRAAAGRALAAAAATAASAGCGGQRWRAPAAGQRLCGVVPSASRAQVSAACGHFVRDMGRGGVGVLQVCVLSCLRRPPHPHTHVCALAHTRTHPFAHLHAPAHGSRSYWGDEPGDRPSAATQAWMRRHIPALHFIDASALPFPRWHGCMQGGRGFVG